MGKKIRWTPPRGIRIYERSDRNKPFIVSWREDGKYKTLAFSTAVEQLQFARQAAENQELPPVSPDRLRRLLEFERKIGGIENLDYVERLYLHRVQVASKPLSDAVEEFCRDKGLEGIDYAGVKRYQQTLGRLVKSFPGVNLADLNDQELTAWLHGLKTGKKIVSAVTKQNYRKLLKTFFHWALLKRYISEDPILRVPKSRLPPEEITFLSVEDGRKLFESNRDQLYIGRLALEAFAGLRYTSARNAVLEDINFEDEGINLPAIKFKTRKRFYVDGFPPNLWEWLRHAPTACWSMTPRQYQEAKRHAFIRAGVPHPHNCLRHSFATYHVAAFGDVGKTATLLCHSGIGLLNRYYRGNTTQREGLEWFEITPESL